MYIFAMQEKLVIPSKQDVELALRQWSCRSVSEKHPRGKCTPGTCEGCDRIRELRDVHGQLWQKHKEVIQGEPAEAENELAALFLLAIISCEVASLRNSSSL